MNLGPVSLLLFFLSSTFLGTSIGFMLIPPQLLRAGAHFLNREDADLANDETRKANVTDDSSKGAATPSYLRRRRKRPKKKLTPKQEVEMSKIQESSVHKSEFPTTGNLPDVYWGSIPVNHIRLHPNFHSLPHPSSIVTLDDLEDARFFRQDSWQWDYLHNGRCTTSQAAAALGFLEPKCGEVLGISPAWRRGGRGAFVRLQQPALRTVEEMNNVLCRESQIESPSINDVEDEVNPNIWEICPENPKFVAEYRHQLSKDDILHRLKLVKHKAKGEYLDAKIRMIWGNTQESTSLLTALNYFASLEEGVTLKEVGMCGAGLSLNHTEIESSLLIGASPDAVICYPDGRKEALEVKNHCPFFSNRGRKRHGGRVKRFSIGDRPFYNKHLVFTQYVSQLQLEMLCLGEECKSAVMVRQTATQGAMVLRMHRDDSWINEMLYWLHRFQRDYVETKTPPPSDFFYNATDPKDRRRYSDFLNRTMEIRDGVEDVAYIPHDNIQRGAANMPFFLDQWNV